MYFKNLFEFLWKNESETELKMKMKLLETNLNNLKDELKEMKENVNMKNPEQTKDPPIIIERINIEKIILDKYELNNNFGQLGIKELKGKLNIGATYGSEFTPNLDDEKEEKKDEGREKTQKEKNKKANRKWP
jgi:hypothetical protein